MIEPKLEFFELEGQTNKVLFVETLQVKPGVECDVYAFDGDKTKDLGIIRIQPGSKTPLQRVLSGDKTIEGHISGNGKLVISRSEGKVEEYEVDNVTHLDVTVMIGDTMQWVANPNSNLTVYEVCYPPYVDGRYKNLEE